MSGVPKTVPHWPIRDDRRAAGYVQWLWKAAAGELDPFVLIVEGSLPSDDLKSASDWPLVDTEAGGPNSVFDQEIRTTEWLDRLAPIATAVVAAGTCAAYGGLRPIAKHRGGVMGVPDYLGWSWKSKAGLPVVCVPGCPVQPENLSETLLYLLYHVSGQAPVVPLDENLRPAWLFGRASAKEPLRAEGPGAAFTRKQDSLGCLAKIGRRRSVSEPLTSGARNVTMGPSAPRITTGKVQWPRAS
jgi:hydrogenase small subunit